ncbi:Metallo-dependent phosphatase-like protein [Talaromyces proteolyticus]|uniref:Metallo-dependent phosphatase-like protein n=1 Tax=Talaromyces proteolyticus TaxID=1131652 RepID=A0AAD4KS42_9EURO|nr:Metallo-dependent phosphatase-like protein [Talaromyces proteolyticus]KAH8695312.1 Metallo-dependent phosphatase-like protein [Talaromyces proteolyticus]
MTYVITKILLFSDTHGQELTPRPIDEKVDVAIHCGDLTEESKLDEFKPTLRYLQQLKADLKLVIAGNHDFTLDTPAFRKLIKNAKPPLEPELVQKTYGDYGEARRLIESMKPDNIIFLDEGSYEFTLRNGALMRVYASPFTPSLSGDWGFQYDPKEGHEFTIPKNTDVVITHGPPLGVLDYTCSRSRAGCPALFQAVARVKPRLHCFGHIHEGWGAKRVAWREKLTPMPSHLTDIDNSKSRVLGTVSQLNSARKNCELSCYFADCFAPEPDQQTLFVNAAIQGIESNQVSWVVEIPLSKV